MYRHGIYGLKLLHFVIGEVTTKGAIRLSIRKANRLFVYKDIYIRVQLQRKQLTKLLSYKKDLFSF